MQLPSSIQQVIDHFVAGYDAVAVGIALHDLKTSREILVQPDMSFHPASTFKVCVMMEAYRQAKQGKLSLEDAILVKNEFSSIADHSPFSLSTQDDAETDLYEHLGERLPLRDLIRRMIVHSSNLATSLLVELLTPGSITEFMHELGAHDLLVRRGVEDNKAYALGLNNAATARSLMRILTRLAERKVVSKKASDEMIAILRQQHCREGIPARLPEEAVIANKTGWNEKLYHDAAIVYPPGRKPYVLVILTRGLPEDKEAPALVASLSRLLYDHLTV